jgi:hypothetical protein
MLTVGSQAAVRIIGQTVLGPCPLSSILPYCIANAQVRTVLLFQSHLLGSRRALPTLLSMYQRNIKGCYITSRVLVWTAFRFSVESLYSDRFCFLMLPVLTQGAS